VLRHCSPLTRRTRWQYSNPNADLFELIEAEDANLMIVDEPSLPAHKDLQGDYHVHKRVQFEENVEFETLIATSIELSTDGPTKPYKAGQIQFDPDTQSFTMDTGIDGVRYNAGEELWYPCINQTGGQLLDGTVVYTSSVDASTDLFSINKAKSDSFFTSAATLGLLTSTLEDGEIGKVTYFGSVKGIDTHGLSPNGLLWLSDTVAGEFTNVKPAVGSQLILLGAIKKAGTTDGEIWVTVNRTVNSVPSYKSETFSSRGVGAGTYYLFGDYIAPTTDITLSQASTTLAFGTANAAYGMRPFSVFAGNGTVDTGQVGLRVSGTTITDAGVRTGGDTQIITEDITLPILDDYLEPVKKFNGAVTYELYVVSGSPTAYSVDFNYGLVKYEDFGNRDFVLTDFEAVGLGGATDVNFALQVLKQAPTGWTYAATGFTPGNGILADLSVSYSPEDNVVNGEAFHFKLDSTALSDVILGSQDEGVLVRIVTTQNNTVQYLNCHIGVSF